VIVGVSTRSVATVRQSWRAHGRATAEAGAATANDKVRWTRMGQLGQGPCLRVVVRATWQQYPAAAAMRRRERAKWHRCRGPTRHEMGRLGPRQCTRQMAMQCIGLSAHRLPRALWQAGAACKQHTRYSHSSPSIVKREGS
jgi:hypothetical protein